MDTIPECANRYEFVKPLGNGAFGHIVLALHKRTRERVAIKLINRHDVIKKDMLQYVDTEIRLLTRINHPSFPKIYEIVYGKDYICIVMEYMENGNLAEIMSSGFCFSYNEKLSILYKILEGIEYLHQRQIAHRDIKPQNIVFDAHYNPKIIDLGLSHESATILATYCGTPNYLAPEIVKNSTYNGFTADIWSFGITAHCIMTNRNPINYTSEPQYIKDIKNGTLVIDNQCHGPFREIIEKCLDEDPMKRPTATELLASVKNFMENEIPHAFTHSNKVFLPRISLKGEIKKCNTGAIPLLAPGNRHLRYRNRILTPI